jgi:hypothetical protein
MALLAAYRHRRYQQIRVFFEKTADSETDPERQQAKLTFVDDLCRQCGKFCPLRICNATPPRYVVLIHDQKFAQLRIDLSISLLGLEHNRRNMEHLANLSMNSWEILGTYQLRDLLDEVSE